MVSDARPQVAGRKSRNKGGDEQEEAQQSRSQQSLNKRIMNTGRKQSQHVIGRDRLRIGQESELARAGKMVPPSDRFGSEADADAARIERGGKRVRDECESDAGI